ncbi:hypothetical protein [Oceanibium sediminis]|uniref:hypothetical protein n=1 Tax=Oceanibium sediminis TaxID=2026339 RepID=UPI000DD366DA|nr:hypothetical protein [Oceanibium sediminis]
MLRIFTLAVLVSGCTTATVPVSTSPAPLDPAAVTVARSTVSQRLRDPMSAQFRNERAYRTSAGDTIICGEVNARNGFGGYVGFHTFFTRQRSGVIVAGVLDRQSELIPRYAEIGCQRAASGQMMVSEV